MSVAERTPRTPNTTGTPIKRNEASRPTGGQRLVRVLRRLLETFGLLIVLLLLWQLVTVLNPSPFFPTPLTIAENTRKLLFSGPIEHGFMTTVMMEDGLATIGRMLIGYVIGAIAGIVIGVITGLSRTFRLTTSPVVEFLRSVPAVATLPLFIILLGGGDNMRISFIAFGVTWFVLINTANGVASIEPTQLMMGKAFRVSKSRRLFRIVLPSALPKIVAGLRIALGAALILAVVSEFMLATNGIGYQLILAQSRFFLLNLWSWLVLLAILGLVLNLILELVERRVLRWHRLQKRYTK